ncbi:UbiA family prenyltransferase [Patescibacteria group bacterium]|nr:UbiA family prenyltransferase [Patescibacteria group bacterium]MBP9709689.1 UbiA family prenyltransferase [Patescibacteria group bacterium]
MSLLPLYVDLDGSLMATDTLWESLVLLIKQRPKSLLRLPQWLARGKAGFKAALAAQVMLDASTLPYREEVVAHIREHKAKGGRVILATAAHETIAKQIATHIACFDAVLASNTVINLAGRMKAEAIQAHAQGRFAYIGDAHVDLSVWEVAEERLLVVHTSLQKQTLTKEIGKTFDHYFEASSRKKSVSILMRAMRLHQWSKNALLFVPVLLAHRWHDPLVWRQTIIAFVSFGLAASSIYLMNDLLDLAADRRHPRKRFRPLASGELSIPLGLLLAAGCFMLALLGSGLGVSVAFMGMIVGYVLATLVYSVWLKRIPIVDVLALAFFYVYRLVAGAVAGGIFLTPWLLAFAAFFFVGLGCLKRVGELTVWRDTRKTGLTLANGRGYVIDDLVMLALFGVNAGFLSLLVLALYINSQEVASLYHRPGLLWGVVAVLVYWVMRVWLLTWRGTMHDDPVLFAMQDKASRLVGALAILCLLLAL